MGWGDGRSGQSPASAILADVDSCLSHELWVRPHLRRAIEVAAAGGHSLMVIGPPGTGGPLVAGRLPLILPSLEGRESMDAASGGTAARAVGPPFRTPHHTISAAGLLGGGARQRVGEALLARGGVLFLHEIQRFRDVVLEALRTRIETAGMAGGGSSASRGFVLAATATPCPCGWGGEDPRCSCSPRERSLHLRRLGRIASMFDLVSRIPVSPGSGLRATGEDSVSSTADRVSRARAVQRLRLGPGRLNADLDAEAVGLLGVEGDADGVVDWLAHAAGALPVARTLADLRGGEAITTVDLLGALRLRLDGLP